MTARAIALVAVTGLSVITGAFAAGTARHLADADTDGPAAARTSAPVPVHWAPAWLMEPLRQAIADATDTRDRKAK